MASLTKPGTLRRHSRNVVLRIVAAQISIGLLIAVGLFFVGGWHESYSALAGALIATLPSYYLANRMFRYGNSTSVEDVLKNIYVAEMLKIGMTVALFVIAIIALNVNFAVVVGVYAAVVAVNWLGIRLADLGERPEQRLTKAGG